MPFESALERDFVVLLDFDPNVVRVQRATAIHYQDDTGRERIYTPDYQVEYWSGNRALYEIKYRSNLWEEWKDLKPRFKAAIRTARANGMQFSIVTDVEIRGTGFLGNVKFLRPYRDHSAQPDIEEHLASTLAVLGESTPQTLLAAAYQASDNRLRALPLVWRMLARGRIHADLYRPLSMATPIWITIGEGYLWQDPHSYQSSRAP